MQTIIFGVVACSIRTHGLDLMLWLVAACDSARQAYAKIPLGTWQRIDLTRFACDGCWLALCEAYAKRTSHVFGLGL